MDGCISIPKVHQGGTNIFRYYLDNTRYPFVPMSILVESMPFRRRFQPKKHHNLENA